MHEPAEILKSVEGLAREAGDILMGYYGEIHSIDYKGIGDIVTEADKASEQLITERLESRFPDYATPRRGIWNVCGAIGQLLGHRSVGRNSKLCSALPDLCSCYWAAAQRYPSSGRSFRSQYRPDVQRDQGWRRNIERDSYSRQRPPRIRSHRTIRIWIAGPRNTSSVHTESW